MEIPSFIYHGIEYQVGEVVRIENSSVEKCYRIRTTDNKFFYLTYNEAIQQWVVQEAHD